MPLLQNAKHKRFHSIGPKDLKWPWRKRPLNIIHVQKEVSSGEHMSVDVPIYKTDSREDITDRVGLFVSILQDRMDEFAEAWAESKKRAEEEVKLAKGK